MSEEEADDNCPLCDNQPCDIWDDTDPQARQFVRTVELPEWERWNTGDEQVEDEG